MQQENFLSPQKCLAFPQSTSCRCGSGSEAFLDGSHCAPHGILDSSDLDTGAHSPALFSLVLSSVTSSLYFITPFQSHYQFLLECYLFAVGSYLRRNDIFLCQITIRPIL